MKDLKNLKGAKLLSKMEQKAVKGGELVLLCFKGYLCPAGYVCIEGKCIEGPL